MKKIFVLIAILSLAIAPAFASNTTGFGSFVAANGYNGTIGESSITTGYYGSGAALYTGGGGRDFEAWFTIQGRNIHDGLFCANLQYGCSVADAGTLFTPGSDVFINFGNDGYGAHNLFYRDGRAQIGQDMAPGPNLYAVGNIDGPSGSYHLSQIGGRVTLMSGSTLLLDCANFNTGISTFSFGGSGTYTVTNFVFRDELPTSTIPEPSSMVALLSGLCGLALICRKIV
ncbi:MAG: PEP-CTERM sorting domain-containing protein [Armatimonadota bacterium]